MSTCMMSLRRMRQIQLYGQCIVVQLWCFRTHMNDSDLIFLQNPSFACCQFGICSYCAIPTGLPYNQCQESLDGPGCLFFHASLHGASQYNGSLYDGKTITLCYCQRAFPAHCYHSLIWIWILLLKGSKKDSVFAFRPKMGQLCPVSTFFAVNENNNNTKRRIV